MVMLGVMHKPHSQSRGEGGLAKCLLYNILLFSKSGYEGGGGVKNFKKVATWFVHDTSDCGPFSLKYAECLSRDAQFKFSQKDMPYYRTRIIYELITNTLISP